MMKIKLLSALLVLCSLHLQAQTDNISPARKQAIDSLALEKVRDLSKYISIIGNKKTQYSEANRVMDRAEELFTPESEMGVSAINKKEVTYYKVRKYFEHLMALNYDHVSIKWYNIHYISDLERQPDGRYVGVVTIYQRFEGESEGGLKYKDTTKKGHNYLCGAKKNADAREDRGVLGCTVRRYTSDRNDREIIIAIDSQ